MRKSFDSLSGLVKRQWKERLLTGDVFIFINRRRDQVKLLVWDRTGFVIYYKRLEQGSFELPCTNEVSWQELLLLLEGVELASIKRRKRYECQGAL